MPGSRIDRARTIFRHHARKGIADCMRPCATLSRVIVVVLTLGTTQTLPAQEGGSAIPPADQRAQAPIKTFRLEAAPEPIAQERPGVRETEDEPPQAESSPLSGPILGVTESSIAQEASSRVDTDRSSPSLEHAIDIKAIRAETADRLRRMEAGAAATSPAVHGSTPRAAQRAGSPAMRELLLERQHRLDEHDQATRELQSLNDPKSSPDRLAAAAHVELDRLKARLSQPPQTLVSPVFGSQAKDVTDAVRGEMKDAIEAGKAELKEWQTKLEAGRGELAGTESTQRSLRALRDRHFQQLATLKARSREHTTAVSAARTSQARQLEQERLVNFDLEARVEAISLQLVEAKLAHELKLVDVRNVRQLELEAHVQLSQRLLEYMQSRYSQLAESQQRELEQAAATQANRARNLGDPLEQYRARREADLLELEAKVVKSEQNLAAGSTPALEEQRVLADRAQADFAEIKQLLDDGNVSRLDALRLTNDFRRIGPERDRLLRDDLTTIEAQLQFYENSLTNVELELIEDSLADQLEHDAVLERIGVEHHIQAKSEFASFEQKRRALLTRRKAALGGLVTRAAQTYEQVTRRLRVLEDEYGFIRTHIFWVRDQEPIGLETVARAGREFKRLGKGLLKLAEEAGDRKLWRQPPSEFMTAAVAAVILPLGLFRLRRLLRRRITRALPPSHLHGGQSEPARGDVTPAMNPK